MGGTSLGKGSYRAAEGTLRQEISGNAQRHRQVRQERQDRQDKTEIVFLAILASLALLAATS
jgi:hypothetical protein